VLYFNKNDSSEIKPFIGFIRILNKPSCACMQLTVFKEHFRVLIRLQKRHIIFNGMKPLLKKSHPILSLRGYLLLVLQEKEIPRRSPSSSLFLLHNIQLDAQLFQLLWVNRGRGAAERTDGLLGFGESDNISY
jgi:hypothetical protein